MFVLLLSSLLACSTPDDSAAPGCGQNLLTLELDGQPADFHLLTEGFERHDTQWWANWLQEDSENVLIMRLPLEVGAGDLTLPSEGAELLLDWWDAELSGEAAAGFTYSIERWEDEAAGYIEGDIVGDPEVPGHIAGEFCAPVSP